MTSCIRCYQSFDETRGFCPSCGKVFNDIATATVEALWEAPTDKTPSSKREPVAEEAITDSLDILLNLLNRRLTQKGRGTLGSRHEVLGIVAEEFAELTEAVRSENLGGVEKELADIAVACVFGIACIRNGSLEW